MLECYTGINATTITICPRTGRRALTFFFRKPGQEERRVHNRRGVPLKPLLAYPHDDVTRRTLLILAWKHIPTPPTTRVLPTDTHIKDTKKVENRKAITNGIDRRRWRFTTRWSPYQVPIR